MRTIEPVLAAWMNDHVDEKNTVFSTSGQLDSFRQWQETSCGAGSPKIGGWSASLPALFLVPQAGLKVTSGEITISSIAQNLRTPLFPYSV